MNFEEFNLHDELLTAIDSMGYKTATPVQQKAIPAILNHHDLLVSAQTGTGKTAAFLLPLIHQIINAPKEDSIKALVLVPTRELVIQIDQLMQGLSYFTNVSSVSVYGGNDGASFSRERQALQTGVDLVVSTPGRLIAHLNMNYMNLNKLQFLVLDEADRMLDIGFYQDIVKIVSHLPKKRQNLLFSATMPKKIIDLAASILHNPLHISIAVSKPAEKIDQRAYVVFEHQKIALITSIFKDFSSQKAIVFCSTKQSVKELSKSLRGLAFSIGEIHSDLDQKERESILLEYRNNKIKILVATDILSRGIDIEDIALVVNFDVPRDVEDYIHRIGRTARAESTGVAITLIDEKSQSHFYAIEQFLGIEITKHAVPAELGEVPLYDPKKHPDNRKKKRFFKKKKK